MSTANKAIAKEHDHARKIKRTLGEQIFDKFNFILLGLLGLSMLYPFWYELALSLADADKVALSKVYIWPEAMSLESYKNVCNDSNIWNGYLWTIIRTVLGTLIALILGFHFAYVLSKKYFPNRKFWTGILVFTMFFSGGMVPEYLLIRDLGLMNSVFALILPGAISAYNITIMRNFLMGLPDSLEESARIDGANDIVILYKIIVPLSLPILATVALWTAVGHWNAWFDAMLYIRASNKQVLAITLRRIVLVGTNASTTSLSGEQVSTNMTSETIKAATIMVATVPILCVYPFVQKYFVKGVLVGSVKG